MKPPVQALATASVARQPPWKVWVGVGVDGVVTAGVVGVVVPTESTAAVSAGYQALEIFWLPASFGCTPSVVSVAVLIPVQVSTTVIGDAAVDLPAAQAGIAVLKATAR